MSFRTFVGVAAVSVLTVASLSSPAAADKKHDDDNDHATPLLLSDTDIDWVAGSSAWVSLAWTGLEHFGDVKVTVIPESQGLSIEYPENHDGFTSLVTDADLSTNEIDFTNFKATTTSANNGTKWASVYVEYTVDGSSQNDEGRYRTYMGRLKFSNKKYKGDDFLILTESAIATSSGDASDNWIEFGYKGLSPLNTNLSVTVSGTDLPIYYPQESFTSLHHDHVLNAGESDVARIWLDPELISAGQESLDLTVSYKNYKGQSKSITHRVELDIQ